MNVVSYDVPESSPYLTSGKIYETAGIRWLPTIIDDEGETIQLSLEDCAHLEGGDWEVVA